jgi:polysaccharide biosynthesis/export protein
MITTSGGLKPDAGSSLQITRQMKWGALPLPGVHVDSAGEYSTAEIPLDRLMSGHDSAENIIVKPNDVISIPRTSVVYVLGQVRKAGGFPLNSHDSISLVRALSLAEGLDRNASPKRARIMRAAAGDSNKADEQQLVNVQDILAGKAEDIQLHPNDVLYIPNSATGSAARRAAEAALQIATGVVIYR